MDTTQLPKDFKEFLKLLNSYQVEYLLIGSYAVGFYGYPRGTVDMDVWVEQSEDNAERIVAMLNEFGFGQAGLQKEWLTQDNKVIRMGRAPDRIEILTTISGVRYEECKTRAVNVEIDGVPVRLIALADLITNKKASGRTKDLTDVEHLPKS